MKNVFRDNFGNPSGYTQRQGNFTQIFDKFGNCLGQHNSIDNKVRDRFGREIGKGIGLLGTLLKK